MAIPRGNCPRDDARLTSAVVACFGAKENQIACITRSFRSPFKGIPLKACGQNIVTGHPAVNPAGLRHSAPAAGGRATSCAGSPYAAGPGGSDRTGIRPAAIWRATKRSRNADPMAHPIR
jgi:hypothetical protein